SPELKSKLPAGDELNDGVRALSEKLSEALLSIRTKEDLVKQHAKVAEEAVSGSWERAENEVLALKKLNDALTQKNSVLDSRASQLDGALKECLRQLRQAREEQQEKIHQAVAEKKSEWESKKSRLDAAEREISNLKLQLVSKDKELALRISESDLSTRAAENASKLHLDGIKKMAKLEAECLKLKAAARKAASSFAENGEDSSSSSSSVTNLKHGKTSVGKGSTVDIDLMDDFLEMERLAAGSCRDEVLLQHQLESALKRTAELEEILKSLTSQKANLEIALHESHIRLKESDDRLEGMREKLADLEMQLNAAGEEKTRMHEELDDSKSAMEEFRVQVMDANLKKMEAEKQISEMEIELQTLHSKISDMEKQIEKETQVTRESVARCSLLEAEVRRVQQENDSQKSLIRPEFRIDPEEMRIAASKFAECQKTIDSLGLQLKSLVAFDDFLTDYSS
ncbi:hypothetical protein M569_14141, partial [Genlisea aurea]